jgi:hypothetical protein
MPSSELVYDAQLIPAELMRTRATSSHSDLLAIGREPTGCSSTAQVLW